MNKKKNVLFIKTSLLNQGAIVIDVTNYIFGKVNNQMNFQLFLEIFPELLDLGIYKQSSNIHIVQITFWMN